MMIERKKRTTPPRNHSTNTHTHAQRQRQRERERERGREIAGMSGGERDEILLEATSSEHTGPRRVSGTNAILVLAHARSGGFRRPAGKEHPPETEALRVSMHTNTDNSRLADTITFFFLIPRPTTHPTSLTGGPLVVEERSKS